MTSLSLAIAVFLATHLIPGLKPVRRFFVHHLGERLYMGAFSVASIVVIIWLGWAYREAPYIELWPYLPELRWLAVLSMPIACFLTVAGLSSANPFSLGLGAAKFDPDRPGIVRLCKHPAFWGLLIWSGVHMAVNGDGASLLLFGLFGLLSGLGPVIMDRRRQSTIGGPDWHEMVLDLRKVAVLKAISQIGGLRIVAAVLLYVALLFVHGPIIGVSPLAG